MQLFQQMYWSEGDGWFGWQSLQPRIIKLVACQTLPVCDNVAAGADYLIAIGGGSPTDTSKAIGIIINNPEFQKAAECLKDYPRKSPADEEIKALVAAEKAF